MNKPFALLIEDDRDVAALFRHVLDMAGYQTEIIFDGNKAINRISTIQPDVVLLDLQLPGTSGVEILKMMRADERMKTIPVVVITAYAYYANSLPVEPDLFLLKPVDIHDLSKLIQRLHATKSKVDESPYDKVTHLYTISFFSVRVVFAIERVKRMDLDRFGILFADLHPIEYLRENWSEDVYNAFLRKLADQFKSTLRPTDTVAWANEGHFLTLFEEVFNNNVPAMITKRVGKGLSDFLEYHEIRGKMKIHIGVVLCDDGYDNAQEILDDVNIARLYIRNHPDADYRIFTRDEISKLPKVKKS